MKRAGLDVGHVLIKAIWFDDIPNSATFASSADYGFDELFPHLLECGITELVVTGRGKIDIPEDFTVFDGGDNLILCAQAANHIVPDSRLSDSLLGFILVDVGFNIKYAFYNKSSGTTKKILSPSPFGGGYLQGQSNILGLDNLMQMDSLSVTGEAPDVLEKDIDSSSCGLISGELIVSSFGLAEKSSPLPDICAGHLQTVANAIQRDMHAIRMMSTIISGKKEIDDFVWGIPVVVVGTPISRLKALRQAIRKTLANVGISTLFLPSPSAESLPALGALIANSQE